jgi:hypothetical protein
VVERIEDNFRPATDCQRAGLAPTPRQTTLKTQLPLGERSALADRIARKRGHDVIVVLRRTTPPYDRKLLRGYVDKYAAEPDASRNVAPQVGATADISGLPMAIQLVPIQEICHRHRGDDYQR